MSIELVLRVYKTDILKLLFSCGECLSAKCPKSQGLVDPPFLQRVSFCSNRIGLQISQSIEVAVDTWPHCARSHLHHIFTCLVPKHISMMVSKIVKGWLAATQEVLSLYLLLTELPHAKWPVNIGMCCACCFAVINTFSVGKKCRVWHTRWLRWKKL